MDDPFAPADPAMDHFQLGIEEVLDDPITSREGAERFLNPWLYDGFGFPLRDSMWEIRTILAPERFEVLQQRLREMDDDAPWMDDYKSPGSHLPSGTRGFWSEGEVIENILNELNAMWDEALKLPDEGPEYYHEQEPREYTEAEDALYGVPRDE